MADQNKNGAGLNYLDADQVIKKSAVVLDDGSYALQTTSSGASAAAVTPSQQLVTKEFSSSVNDFSVTSGITPLAVATSTLLKAAGTSGIRNYVTSLQLYNTSATVSTTVSILDGSTILWTGFLPATTAALPIVPTIVEFLSPLKGTAVTALNIQLGTTLASVYYNVQGYQGL